MGLLATLFRRKPSEPIEMGPLYPEVRDAMHEVQAYARSHGGNIELAGVSEQGEVRVRLSGTCRGCPMSAITLKLGVEQRLRILVPGVSRVVQLD